MISSTIVSYITSAKTAVKTKATANKVTIRTKAAFPFCVLRKVNAVSSLGKQCHTKKTEHSTFIMLNSLFRISTGKINVVCSNYGSPEAPVRITCVNSSVIIAVYSDSLTWPSKCSPPPYPILVRIRLWRNAL